MALQGCATIRGSQDPLPELRPSDQAVSMKVAVMNFYSSDASTRGGLPKAAYRNTVINEYIQRIKSRYDAFVDQLYSGDRATALGFDFLQLGLAGATGLVKQSAVDELATASTITAGARASIDKRVFYNRTITALVASMDADRASILADIARKRKLPASEYTLDDAFLDLNLLADAGSINRALSRINHNAEADRAAEQARLDNISAACDDINLDDAALRQEFRLFLDADPANVTAAASAMEIDLPAGQDPKAVLRNVFATDFCGNAAKRELLDQLAASANNPQ